MLEDIVGFIVVITVFAVPIVLVIRGEEKRRQAEKIRRQYREERRLAGAIVKQERQERKKTKEEASKVIEAQLQADLPPPSEQAELIAEWMELLNRRDVLILDTETTARNTDLAWLDPEVMEVAVIDTTGALRYRSYSSTEMPLDKMSNRKAHVVSKGPPWTKVHLQLYGVLKDASVVLAWNAGFDRSRLMQTSDKYNLNTPPLPWRDALADYRRLRPGGSHSLAHALDREGVRENIDGPLHWARYDCLAVLEVMRAVTRDRDDEVVYIRKLPESDRSGTPIKVHKSAMCIRIPENWQAARSIEDVRKMFPNRRISLCTRCSGSGKSRYSPLTRNISLLSR